jgi:hypothetical protein
MNTRAMWVMNGLLAAVVGLLLVLMLTGSPRNAQASGGGPSLSSGWMATVLSGGSEEYLVLMKQKGDNVRIHLYQPGGPLTGHTMKLVEVRDTEYDFALKMTSVASQLTNVAQTLSWDAIRVRVGKDHATDAAAVPAPK